MMKIYCPKCDKIEDAKIITKDETYNIKGSAVKTKANVAQCKKCGEEVFDEELDGNNLEAAYNVYRKMHELLTPSQIKAIREKYDLSQRALGTLLEWGEITVHRYESGGIQDKVHNDVLVFIENPDNMKEKFEQSGRLLPSYVQAKLKERITQLIEEEIVPKFDSAMEQRLMPKEQLNEFTGFKRFDLEKTKNLITYIACAEDGFYKTKLNKLVWYMDFLHYKTYTTSITGNVYMHSDFGPTFNSYELILGAMLIDNLIEKKEVIKHNDVREIWKPVGVCSANLFNETEKKVIDAVIRKFKGYDCAKISKYSHEEKAYKSTKMNEKISYKLSESLSLSI